ncbi:MAG: hypothetical protein ACYC3L_10480 [Gemmatimonadaceae bacterium]
MKAAVLLALLGALASRARAQDAEWVEVDSRALLAGDRSAADAKRDALYGALAEAVRRVAGVTVSGSTMAVRTDSAGTSTDHFVEAVRLDAEGRAIAWQVLHEGWRTMMVPGIGSQAYYEMRVRVRVQREHGTADAGFSVRLAANAEQYVVRGAAPAGNDEVLLTVTTSAPAVLTIVSIVDDSVFVLVPNALMPDVRTTALMALEVPDAVLRGNGLRFRMTLPDDVSRRTELLAVVATRQPVPLLVRTGEGAARDTGRLTLADFSAWLLAIPRRERAVAQVVVEVRRAR